MEFIIDGKIGAFQCQNCDLIMAESAMRPLSEEGILERVAPGERMPHGECPNCGAVVHPLDLKEERHLLGRRILMLLRDHCSARCMDDEEDRLLTASLLAKRLKGVRVM